MPFAQTAVGVQSPEIVELLTTATNIARLTVSLRVMTPGKMPGIEVSSPADRGTGNSFGHLSAIPALSPGSIDVSWPLP